MLYSLMKIVISAILIALISEVSKRSSLVGGITASVPLISVLAIIWLYRDTHDTQRVIELSYSVFWLVLPSLSLFLVLPVLLRAGLNFAVAMVIGLAVMVVLYYAMTWALLRFGVVS